MTKPIIDRIVRALFKELCVYLVFNPPDADSYRTLHAFLLEWANDSGIDIQ